MQIFELDDQLCLFAQDSSYGKTSPEPSPAASPGGRTSGSSWRRSSASSAIPYQFLDLTPGCGDLLGESYWEIRSPWLGGSSTLNYAMLHIIELMESWTLWKDISERATFV